MQTISFLDFLDEAPTACMPSPGDVMRNGGSIDDATRACVEYAAGVGFALDPVEVRESIADILEVQP